MRNRSKFPDSSFKVSTLCDPHPNFCVAVAKKGGLIAVRNSADPKKKIVTFTDAEWSAFIAGVKNGEFD